MDMAQQPMNMMPGQQQMQYPQMAQNPQMQAQMQQPYPQGSPGVPSPPGPSGQPQGPYPGALAQQQVSDFKTHQLPLARIKKIMKADEDVRMISAEAPVLFAKACEMFILELTLRSWIHTEENKRRTLQKNDIAAAITRTDIFDFLVDIVPRDELKDETALGGVPRAALPVGSPADAIPYGGGMYYVATGQPQGGPPMQQGQPNMMGSPAMMVGRPGMPMDPAMYGQQARPPTMQYMPPQSMQQMWPQSGSSPGIPPSS
ncbi:hypothetical protein AXG93_1923s1490 [Marchantia polymorpha subsp. ruderalis]|uniref:Core Histone H2A/H2B/H3 domain-containing protein n=1 Tax=Marchantia polymorpha subsp. ruderalis TaxID=1480154 RepID=A0A176VDH9_MARPO|nr:hypothetical protein AXG93_1923s1490 [Marchantia polymorpha subsp. ruderalis]